MQGAFEDLQHALVTPPVPVSPDFTQPFVVQTDASSSSLGAILTQVLKIYISCKLQPAEQKYSTIEGEVLAIKWATETLQLYLVNNPFMLLMDHAPLQWLHRVKGSNLRVLCWYLSLLPSSFQIQHRKGSTNENTNYLSRLFNAKYFTPRGGGM